MKKLTYLLLGFVVGAVLTYYFCPNKGCAAEQELAKPNKPKGVVTVAEAIQLNDNWTKYRKPAIDSTLKIQGVDREDYRSAWWSLKDINDYLAYAKQQSDSLGYTVTGVRVCLGVYGENAGQNKKDLTTMFIVPTGEKSTSKASSLNITIAAAADLPVPPMNDGTGGPGFPR